METTTKPELPALMVEAMRALVEMLEADGRWPVATSGARVHLDEWDKRNRHRVAKSDLDPKIQARIKAALSGDGTDLCPVCGSDMAVDVSYDTEDHIGGGLIAQPGRCPDCLASWSDIYELNDVALDIIPPGVFTSWGDALCQDCHDRDDVKAREGWRAVTWQGLDVTTIGYCTFCGEQCRLPYDVAILTRVLEPTDDGSLVLEHTGGGCAALFHREPNGGRVIVVTVEDTILVGDYESEAAWQTAAPGKVLAEYKHHREAHKAVRELIASASAQA